jgi:Uma2 family endonuclease
MATTVRVTLQEFLALPESKPYLELMDGEVIEKAMPNAAHGLLTSRLIFLLSLFQQRNGSFHVMNEVRQVDTEHEWVFLPDISIILKSRLMGPAGSFGNPVTVVPDFAIEVLSHEDRPGMLARRVAYYQRAGVALLWTVDPESESITAWERGAEPIHAMSNATISAAPILPGFEVSIADLFAVLHEE